MSSGSVAPPRRRRFWIPEVIQSSSMDCGPAALKSMLAGFGVRVAYGRLRELCKTEVDGTSITALEGIAAVMNRPLEQVCLPLDDLGGPSTTVVPCITMIRPTSGPAHFVVVWRRIGPWVQVMDPGRGRTWMRWSQLQRILYVSNEPVEAEDWCEFMASEDARHTWSWAREQAGIDASSFARRAEDAWGSGAWPPIAAVDASLRMCAQLCRISALRPGPAATALFEDRVRRALDADGRPDHSIVPREFWAVSADANEPDGLILHGGLFLRLPSLAEERELLAARTLADDAGQGTEPGDDDDDDEVSISPAMQAALVHEERAPLRRVFALAVQDGWIHPLVIVCALVAVAAMRVVEALLMRGLIDLQTPLGLGEQRLGAAAAITGLLGLAVLLQMGVARAVWGLARSLELRLRVQFWRKIPRLSDGFFQSRLRSDMAERAHSSHALRDLPQVISVLISSGAAVSITLVAIATIDMNLALWLAGVTAIMSVAALAMSGMLTERTSRFLGLRASLTSYFLDALGGATALRSQGAETRFTELQESVRGSWERAGYALLNLTVVQTTILRGFGMLAVAWLLWPRLGDGQHAAVMLLLAYWALELPEQAIALATTLLVLPELRGLAIRAIEPLDAPEPPGVDADEEPLCATSDAAKGVDLEFRDLSIVIAGRPIVQHLDLHLEPGEHVAIVGASGAGKSSLVGTLLGFHTHYQGELRIDGQRLTAAGINALRRRTAWVDPSVQLWNRSLLANVTYGRGEGTGFELSGAMADAQLDGVLGQLEQGLDTGIGEDGSRLSGGEGQRVRFARALVRPGVDLVILDEAFRGLARDQRSALLAASRRRWHRSTLISVSHDIRDTRDFPRVIVVHDGHILQDGAPDELLRDECSPYAQLLASEREVLERLWTDARWRRLEMRDGRLHGDSGS